MAGDGRPAAADHRRRRLPRLLLHPGRHPLQPQRRQGRPDRRHGLRQPRARRPGLARRPARRGRAARSSRTTCACRCPQDFGQFDYVIHAASVASPTYYRAHPVETMDANINGLRNLLDHARARMDRKDPVGRLRLPVEQRDLRRPGARGDPHARGLSRLRLLHRPARLLRRGQALRRDHVHGVREQVRRRRPRSRARSTITGRG